MLGENECGKWFAGNHPSCRGCKKGFPKNRKVIPFLVEAGVARNTFNLHTEEDEIVASLELWYTRWQAGANLLNPENGEPVDSVTVGKKDIMEYPAILDGLVVDMLSRSGMCFIEPIDEQV